MKMKSILTSFIFFSGVFREMVEWCLVLTTKEEAMICAIAKTSPSLGSPWTVVPTKFVIPSDWVSFLCVASTKSGRIFLGGQDGNLYELDYDMLVQNRSKYYGSNGSISNTTSPVQQSLDRFYDGSDDINKGPSSSTACPDVIIDKTFVANQSTTERLLNTGKRALEATFPGSTRNTYGYGDSELRPRKCRKLNHSDKNVLSKILPDFVTKVGSAIFGDSSSTYGGAITQIVVDDERQLLYTLSSPKGWICVFDILAPSPTLSSGDEINHQHGVTATKNSTLSLVSVFDAPSTARSYLESVGRGRLNPTSSSPSTREGLLSFLGNAQAAQAGVGGMEGARRILRLVESSKAASRKGGRNKGEGVTILTPVSLQIVPCQESTRITLVAITSGGLRYYLSTLDQRHIGGGPPNTRPGQNPWKPSGSRMTLYHVRAPPSFPDEKDGMNHLNGRAPTVLNNQQVDAACYRLGAFIVAFQPNTASAPKRNDVLVAATPDSTKRVALQSDSDGISTITYVSPGGICELLSLNLSSQNGMSGGRVWGIEQASVKRSTVLALALHSKTPTDTELNYVVPPFSPSGKKQGLPGSSSNSTSKTDLLAPKSKSVSSVGFAVFTNILLGRPAAYGIEVQKPTIKPHGRIASYRVSLHSGSSGFSMSAADVIPQIKSGSLTRSARLSPWLLHPRAAPLDPLALQHLEPYETGFLALNVGGIHLYQSVSILGQLSKAITAAGVNAESDPIVAKFFEDYGHDEVCAMCFMLAIAPSSSNDLKQWALQVAMRHSYTPQLIAMNETQIPTYRQTIKDDPWVPAGYTLKPSAICEGLYLSLARLLRPIWYKPAVVVTEGRLIKRGLKLISTPAKVELLLEDDTLEQILGPLEALVAVVARFRRAIEHVPSKAGRSVVYFNSAEADELARRIEERNIHSLYRLLSRTIQLLKLLYHLRKANALPDLPEVEWGMLHGIQFAQLVESILGQERIENVLNKIVTSTGKLSDMPSADANSLAEALSQNCYYFFSSGNWYSYLGFKSAHEALAAAPESQGRKMKAKEAANYLNMAAKNWYSPTLITGQLLQTRDSEGFGEVAQQAIQHNSPLAKACSFLAELGDVANLVNICLATASNFTSKEGRFGHNTVSQGSHSWEVGLYHNRLGLLASTNSSGSPGTSVALGTHVTPKDAVTTCYSLVFYHLSKFLQSPLGSTSRQMGENMVSACAYHESDGNGEFIRAFFDFLLRNGQKDVLLRITSQKLEDWLVEREKQDPGLLMKFYQIQGKHREAGDLALRRANDPSERTIHDRIELLETAVASFSASTVFPNSSRSMDQEVETLLEVAKLQAQALRLMDSAGIGDRLVEEKKRLEYTLLTASDLLNNVTWCLEMHELCLLLFSVCKCDDIGHIQKLWKSYLSSMILPCATRNVVVCKQLENFVEGTNIEDRQILLLGPADSVDYHLFEDGLWPSNMKDAVVRMGKEIIGRGTDFVFPVDFIANCLEGKFAGCTSTLSMHR